MAKTILITGGNRGIGREIARQMVEHGWRVFIGVRDPTAGEIAAAAIGGEVEALTLDVTKEASIDGAAQRFGSRVDHLDVLVNNAAIYPDEPGDSVLTVDPAKMRAAYETNVIGSALVSCAFLPWLRRAGNGQIIHLGSGYGQINGMSHEVPAYCLSKLALHGLAIQQAAALTGTGVRVNVVCPGWVRTDMGGPNAPRTVEEGADTVVWLARETDRSLHGQIFRDRQPVGW